MKIIWGQIYNIFRLPTPVELGKSIHNLLPQKRSQSDTENVYSYEEYISELKLQFPIRFFLYFTLIEFFNKIQRRINRIYTSIISIGKLKNYLLDLRVLDSEKDFYRNGKISADRQLVLANFKILEQFIENELNNESLLEHKKLQKQYPNLNFYDKQWYEDINSLLELYSYWKHDRIKLYNDSRKIYKLYAEAIKTNNLALSQKLLEDYHHAQNKEVDVESQMLRKLINCRFGLWKA